MRTKKFMINTLGYCFDCHESLKIGARGLNTIFEITDIPDSVSDLEVRKNVQGTGHLFWIQYTTGRDSISWNNRYIHPFRKITKPRNLAAV